MESEQTHAPYPSGSEPEAQGVGTDFAVPLRSLTRGRLIFAAGAARVAIHGDAMLPDLYHARFVHYVPLVWVQEGTVTIQYGHVPGFAQPASMRGPLASVTLNGAIPWDLEFRGLVSRLNADLRGLALRALDQGAPAK